MELSRGLRAFGSWSPFGQGLTEEQTMKTVNPRDTVLSLEDDFTSPPIVFENRVPPQQRAPSFPPMPFDNVLPPPTLRSIDSEKRVDDASFRRDTDIRKNRVVTVRPFTCAGKCGDSKW
jgi:hypothetical protein